MPDSNLNCAATVMFYYPKKDIDENVRTYINDVAKIYFIDNSEEKSIHTDFLISDYQFKTKLIHDGINEGISKRLNHACELAIKDGFDFLLTMDQDSYFDESAITKYLQCIQSHPAIDKVAMFGINYENQINQSTCNYKNVNLLITSGSIINLNNYKKTGGFDEKLFIDFVDTDYCFKSILAGYELIQFFNISMHHTIGVSNEERSFKSLKKSKRSVHSSIRLYYMFRNFLYLHKKYKNKFPAELSIHKKDLLNRIKNKLLYKSNRLQTIKLLMKAFKDYKKNKMGRQL